jgi:exopolysaccharide biosynthesis polyprenyl glycosylphosphotransferase
MMSDENVQAQLAILRRRKVTVHLLFGLKGINPRHLRTTSIGHDPGIYLAEQSFERAQQVAKRCLDVMLGAVALIAAAPIILVAASAIKLQDHGPVLFKQRRVGRDGELFWVYKLRTMHRDAESRLDELRCRNERTGGPLFKLTNDPRVTRAGRFLRATSIDELPQLWCVLRGDMSLVGPRPALPDEVAEFDRRLSRRAGVRPGITGLWQVEQRDAAAFDHYRRLDIFYVENWSLVLDLAILIRTVPAMLSRATPTRRVARADLRDQSRQLEHRDGRPAALDIAEA